MAVRLVIVTACGKVAPKSGFCALRYRVNQLVSTLRFMRLVRGGVLEEPVAVLPCRVRNLSRLTGSAPCNSKYAFRNAAWLISSLVLLVIYCGPSVSRLERAV